MLGLGTLWGSVPHRKDANDQSVVADAQHEARSYVTQRSTAEDIDAAVWVQFGRMAGAEAVPVSRDTGRGNSSLAGLQGSADWRSLLVAYPDWDTEIMARIIQCESHGDENVVSPDGRNVGAFQLNVIHGFSYEDATNPPVATALAHDVWLSEGYDAWSCYALTR